MAIRKNVAAPPVYEMGQMTGKPLEYYSGVFATLDPQEIAARTGVPYDAEKQVFTITLMGMAYAVSWPGADVIPLADSPREDLSKSNHATVARLASAENRVGSPSGQRAFPINPYERILILRYLDEGKYIEPIGKYIAYNEMPWGDVYGSNFQGRVIRRFLHEFGSDTASLKRIMEETPGLCAAPEPKCDVGYSFLFMNGLSMKILMWEGDDEFPPSVQMLYDETVVFGYTAEDVAVAGDILIARLKVFRKQLAQ
ncbi:MAG: DUF3786 domain-containing protein [Clostridiales Family XIII bacterium]|jgi:hypothetical protein|nr:DUF3786 domain-containing protein [Clostridiales Family XIII bacterium]